MQEVFVLKVGRYLTKGIAVYCWNIPFFDIIPWEQKVRNPMLTWYLSCIAHFVYFSESNTWSALAPTGKGPSSRDKMASAAIGDKIYIFGGFGPQSEEEEVEEASI